MQKKRFGLALMHNWIFSFAFASAAWLIISTTCCATPPTDKKSRFLLIGDQRKSTVQTRSTVRREVVLGGISTEELAPPGSPRPEANSTANNQGPEEFSSNSSRKAQPDKPAKIARDRGLELSLESGATTGNEASKGKHKTAQPPLRTKVPVHSDIVEQQAKDSNERPYGSVENQPLDSSSDDVPLAQGDHPYNAPPARSEIKDSVASRTNLDDGQLSKTQLVLRKRINDCLLHYLRHPESVARRSPWAVMHATLPYGAEAELIAGNRTVNAIGWMCYNGVCKTQRMFQPTTTGFRTNIGPGVQGHEGQLLAILAQSYIPHSYPIRIGEKHYKIEDLVRYEMATCRENSELTFKLIGLSYYLHPQQRWRDNQGHSWTLEKMVAEELDQPVVGAACGGTHRLMGLSFSLDQRRRAGFPISGHWERAEKYLDDFVSYAISLQNPDGSFSSDWFERRANDPNLEKKVQTTGHILEWLIFTIPDEQLQSQSIERAVQFLLAQIYDNRDRDWPIGPRGHSLRALALYNQRVFGATPGKLKSFMAGLENQSLRR